MLATNGASISAIAKEGWVEMQKVRALNVTYVLT